MTLSHLIKSNSPKEKVIRILSSNGIDENIAIVLDDNKQNKSNQYYQKNRLWILEKKKVYALKNKEHIAEYHKNYYETHKDEMNRMQRERYRNKKIRSKQVKL
jgi:hypothetical protein